MISENSAKLNGRKSLKLEDGGEQQDSQAEEGEKKVFEGSRACFNILLPLRV